ncbi:hypothetical protein Y032_0525g2928 [Ancylostoma ceylanicum]|uniref:Uncharacterized protein n=1 Tax=Ancylostoma ceylanicum TaxID=53326 RepID=A0A016WSJ3_9BILA|nr:hypothetical protein Y032_0525g2928 [Ancylostoma ceylanicum]
MRRWRFKLSLQNLLTPTYSEVSYRRYCSVEDLLRERCKSIMNGYISAKKTISFRQDRFIFSAFIPEY